MGNGCVNNRSEKIYFTNLPSATKILLTDANTCSKTLDEHNINDFFKNTFWIELRITKDKASIAIDTPLTLQTIAAKIKNDPEGKAQGKIVVPGVQILDSNIPSGADAVFDSLSCIRITTSAPNNPVQPASIDLGKAEWRDVDTDSNLAFEIECAVNEVLTGVIRNPNDPGLKIRQIRCQPLIQNGKTLEVTDNHWEPAAVWPIDTHATRSCKPDQVVTGLNAVPKSTRYRVKCGTVSDPSNKSLIVIPDSAWQAIGTTTCTDSKVISGFRFFHMPGFPPPFDLNSYVNCASVKGPADVILPS
ncbi:hypothetical protein SB766_01605 [Pseudomonas sp. SIMBA_077]